MFNVEQQVKNGSFLMRFTPDYGTTLNQIWNQMIMQINSAIASDFPSLSADQLSAIKNRIEYVILSQLTPENLNSLLTQIPIQYNPLTSTIIVNADITGNMCNRLNTLQQDYFTILLVNNLQQALKE